MVVVKFHRISYALLSRLLKLSISIVVILNVWNIIDSGKYVNDEDMSESMYPPLVMAEQQTGAKKQDQDLHLVVDILSVASTERPEYVQAQYELLSSHSAVQNLMNVT
jgi:hypothetical protein